MSKKDSFGSILITFMILLGIVLIFAEDIALLAGWSVSSRTLIIFLSFVVDLFFSIEFVVNTVIKSKDKKFKIWFNKENGWIDLISSWPLLLFSSGPLVYGLLLSGAGRRGLVGMMGLLRVVRVFRIARVFRIFRIFRVFRFLRLLRLVRLPGIKKIVAEELEKEEKIESQNKNLILATVRESAIIKVLVSFVLVLLLSPIFSGIFYSPDKTLDIQKNLYKGILQDWYQSMYQGDEKRLEYILTKMKDDPNVLYFFNGGAMLVNNTASEEPVNLHLLKRWFYSDYKFLTYQTLKIYYSTRSVEKDNAKVNLLLETLVVVQILVLLFFGFKLKET